MKNLLPLFIMLLLFLYTGCSQNKKEAHINQSISEGELSRPDANTKPISEQNRHIALVMKTLTNPFFIEMEKGAREAEKELGINLTVKTGAKETSIEQQISIVQDLIKEKVEAIVIAPASSVELIPVLKSAQDKGIVIVNIDNLLDPDRAKETGLYAPFISVDNFTGAYKSAKYISEKMSPPAKGEMIKAAVIEGIRSAFNAEDRKRGAIKAFSENPSIRIEAMETANWKIDEAYNVTKEILKQHPDLKLLFCANDMMALGAVQYLKQAGKKDVLIAAYDNLKEAREAIARGELAVTIDQHAAKQGYMGIKTAVDMLENKPVKDVILIDTLVITSEKTD